MSFIDRPTLRQAEWVLTTTAGRPDGPPVNIIFSAFYY